MSNPGVSSITACFPCYNDAKTIAMMVKDVRGALAPLVDELEIVVVDDGSRDGSPDVLHALQAEVPELVVVVHERNRGYGGALISAFTTATKDWIVYTDGDAQYDAKEAATLVAAVTPSTDVVQGYKIGRGDPSLDPSSTTTISSSSTSGASAALTSSTIMAMVLASL